MFELAAGLALLVGWQARWSAVALALFTVVATVLFHAFWSMPAEQQNMQKLMFMKNVSIVGGLLMVAAFGPGSFALGRDHAVGGRAPAEATLSALAERGARPAPGATRPRCCEPWRGCFGAVEIAPTIPCHTDCRSRADEHSPNRRHRTPRCAAPPPPRAHAARPLAAAEAEVNRYLAAYIMGIANRLANGASNHYRSEFGMGMSEWRAMMAIGTSSHRIVREVSEMADLDYAAASKSLKLLQQRGLVAIEQTRRRGRAAIASLTPEGLEIWRKLRASAQKRQKRLVGGFSEEELETLWALLQTDRRAHSDHERAVSSNGPFNAERVGASRRARGNPGSPCATAGRREQIRAAPPSRCCSAAR